MEELENEISTQEEENTVSLASAQALADALTKIEAYTPTTWVDNSSPDIDAEHLNKPEQAIKRVTDALNSAVDVIKDLQSQVTKNSGAISDVNNNLSNAGIPTVKKTTDLYAIKKSGFYYYDAGATNAPMSSRGGMIVANYLSDSWISLTVVPYALSKIYTNTKYNNTWVGWAESATKNDLLISASGTGPTDWTALETVENMPFKIWNVTKASTSKGAPAGCYDYGTLIALVATSATGDRWRNTLIYLPDNNNNVGNKVYVRSGISTKWLAISGTDVNSVS